MEKEVRYYYSLTEEDRIINFLREIKKLKYIDRFYEKTIQYDHPIEEESDDNLEEKIKRSFFRWS